MILCSIPFFYVYFKFYKKIKYKNGNTIGYKLLKLVELKIMPNIMHYKCANEHFIEPLQKENHKQKKKPLTRKRINFLFLIWLIFVHFKYHLSSIYCTSVATY